MRSWLMLRGKGASPSLSTCTFTLCLSISRCLLPYIKRRICVSTLRVNVNSLHAGFGCNNPGSFAGHVTYSYLFSVERGSTVRFSSDCKPGPHQRNVLHPLRETLSQTQTHVHLATVPNLHVLNPKRSSAKLRRPNILSRNRCREVFGGCVKIPKTLQLQ